MTAPTFIPTDRSLDSLYADPKHKIHAGVFTNPDTQQIEVYLDTVSEPETDYQTSPHFTSVLTMRSRQLYCNPVMEEVETPVILKLAQAIELRDALTKAIEEL